MLTRRTVAVVLVVIALLLGACSQTPTPAPAPTPAEVGTRIEVPGSGSYQQISPAELQDLIAGGGITLVNVHVPYGGEIEPTDLFLPYDQIAELTDQLPDESAAIVLYCMTGPMSTSAANELEALGYTRIYELRGGMVAWEADGLPLKK